MRMQDANLVSATSASALVFGESLPVVSAFDVPDSGERAVHLQRLRAHRADGFSYDLNGSNCILRWARVPATHNGPVDVVVHFHGYKGHNQMRLAAKAAASGLDLGTPGVARPTLGVVPHGHAFRSRTAGLDGFDFPAIATKAQLDAFIDEVLAAFASQTGAHPTRGRVILTGHSGGGAALTALMRSIGSQPGVHGFQYFDATYGGQATLTARQGWVESVIERCATALVGISGDEARRRYIETQGSHLRICFIDGTGTAAAARAADAFIREHLAARVSDAALRELLRKYYRAQKVAHPNQVNHGLVPRTYGGRLLAEPGNDLSPEAQDLTATAARAHGFSDDPLGLSAAAVFGTPGALGYGQTWDERIRTTVEGFLASFMAIPVRIGSQTVGVHPPYFMNASSSSAAATRERHRIAIEHRAAAPASLRALINESRFVHARIGKSTPELLRDLLQTADERGLLQADATVNHQPTPEHLHAFLQHYGLGVDCSGFVSQAINKVIGLFPNAAAGDRIAAPHSTSSAALKGGQGSFERVTDPAQLNGGDTMWLTGHIRILAWAARRGDRIVFCTAESRSSNPRDIGPSVAYWRLMPDPQAGSENFQGWRLERSNDLNAPDSGWRRVTTTHVYGHYRPLRRLLQAAGVTPAALGGVNAWALQAAPQPYLPPGGRSFVPRQATFNCAPTTPFTVVPASFLPSPTTNAAAAIDTALTVAGLDAGQRARISRAGLTPLAAAFGASALTELFARLRWSAASITRWGETASGMLVPRLLIHIPGHFRELARRAPSAVEAFVLECLGWETMSNLRQAVENATGRRWWIPPAPDFVTAVPNPIPAVSAEVRQAITGLLFIDTTMPAANWNARFLSWRTGLAGRQWDAEVAAAQPGLPLYASLLSVPAHVNTATVRAAFNAAWNLRVADADTLHAPIPAGAAQVTLPGLLNAVSLRECDNGNPHIPAGTLGVLSLQGLEFAEDFPVAAGGSMVRRLTLLNRLHPVCTALFRAIRELGWNDLVYQTSGATCFRGVKHNPRVTVNVGGNPITLQPFAAPNATTITQINNLANAAGRHAVIAAARSARTLSDHGLGLAVDINYPENVDNIAARPFGSMDPRVVAIFEAFNFRWGACFNPTDPHHFDYCQNACAPAPVAATPAPPAGPLPGMIPSGSGGGPVIA